jgi:hypothetical protein
MRVTATIRSTGEGLLAECSEYDVQGVGSTITLALEALREALYERVVRPQAVAPPVDEEQIEIVLSSELMPGAAAPSNDSIPRGE